MAAAASVKSEAETKLPAAFTLSQSIFESGWGSRMPGNNCFGIQVDHHGSGAQYIVSHEFLDGTWRMMTEWFEKYDNLADCFLDHSRLITEGKRYAVAWAQFLQDGLVDAFVRKVGPIYATDPRYADKILGEMHGATVTAALAKARGSV